MYNRQKERHFPKADMYDDVRENIINYDDEGGGEDDMTAFDITPLQIPVGPAIGNGGPLLSKMPCKFSFSYSQGCGSEFESKKSEKILDSN